LAETDSFIEEVSQEVRRDHLFGAFKKYAWAIALVLIAVIGGMIFSEWQKARVIAQNQAAGDALLAALSEPTADARVTALASAAGDAGPAQSWMLLGQAAALVEAGKRPEAIEVYNKVASDGSLSLALSDLARLKLLMLDPQISDADQLFDILTTAGRPYRLLALELRAQTHLSSGDNDAAIADLTAILESPLTSRELLQRAQQMMIVLGGEMPAAVRLPDDPLQGGDQ